MVNTTLFGCLVIPHLPVRLALRQHPIFAGTPIAIATAGQRGTLIDCSPQAFVLGLRVGMLAREAQSLCPQATILPADPLAYAAEHTLLVQSLAQVCPTLRSGVAGRIDLDLRGLDRHYANPSALGQALLNCIDARLHPRLGMAASTFVALVAARRASSGRLRIVDETMRDRLLERFPVRSLPLEPVTLRRMDRFGLRSLADIAQMPLTALIAQFGTEGKRAWHFARGEDPQPFVAEPVVDPMIELLQFPTTTAIEADLAVALRILASRLLARPELRGQAIQRLRLDLWLEHGSTAGRIFLVKDGTRDARRLAALMRSQLGNVHLDAPVTAMQLEVLAMDEQAPHQMTLGDGSRRARERLHSAVGELSHRYETSPLYQVVEVNRWARLPEHRWALATYEP